jgi:hypothetical protein
MHELGLISPIRCFQQIHVLPLGQRASKGLSIFLPIDLQKQTKTLPRVAGDSDVITVRLPDKNDTGRDANASDLKVEVCLMSAVLVFLTSFPAA